jgi:hypothetical protein
MPSPISSHSSFPIFSPSLLLAMPFNLPTQKMSPSGEADHSVATDEIQAVGTESFAAAGNESPFSTSSSIKADQAMVKKQISNLFEYWKEPMVDEKDIANFHDAVWLPGGLLCTPTTLEFPTIDRTNIVCFELHLNFW